ncbi:hypothetical protein PQR63_07505 [Herbaspirillum rhizosphaerae]|uniref:Uncharacterized protein n=1 Tax=Herbaspirillum rhizosphaerae TaxID=346179 RepID=A0ABW8Z7B7_9BURK
MDQVQQNKCGNCAHAADGNGDTCQKKNSSVEGEITLMAAHGIVGLKWTELKDEVMVQQRIGLAIMGQHASINISQCDVFIFVYNNSHRSVRLLLKIEIIRAKNEIIFRWVKMVGK